MGGPEVVALMLATVLILWALRLLLHRAIDRWGARWVASQTREREDDAQTHTD